MKKDQVLAILNECLETGTNVKLLLQGKTTVRGKLMHIVEAKFIIVAQPRLFKNTIRNELIEISDIKSAECFSENPSEK